VFLTKTWNETWTTLVCLSVRHFECCKHRCAHCLKKYPEKWLQNPVPTNKLHMFQAMMSFGMMRKQLNRVTMRIKPH